MVLKILYAVLPAVLPSKYYFPVILAGVTLFAIYTYAQGRKTSRERDLHGRTILVTGAFTPIGLTLLDSLARRGAHIIALSSEPVDAGQPAIFIPLLRTTTNNENVYAEQCDLTSPASIRAFCTGFVKAEEQRLDAIIFAHEYAPVGSIYSSSQITVEKMRRAASCATFMLATLLLPVLLVAPVERDIRLITLINPFYAAAAPNFSVSVTSTPGLASPPAQASLLAVEGRRALRSAILMRHFQRVMDALPGGAQVPRTDTAASSIPVVSDKAQRSNIVAMSVSPGMSRTDIVAPLLDADASRGPVFWRGLLLYVLFNPLFRLVTKSPASALEAVLHTLFLPTPFKIIATSLEESTVERSEEEILKPGSLYAECAVVRLRVPPAPAPPENDSGEDGPGKGKMEADEATGSKPKLDDGELGGEVLGTMVWEEYERELKEWEAAEVEVLREAQEREKAEKSRDGRHTPPTVDTPS
ncbi:hypothetical protein OF83DRAFT_1240466 [Amylostereum chailletii]|nr:hypothetical protein OF83DRAFT_1240466 [Amylostereum chailletii]